MDLEVSLIFPPTERGGDLYGGHVLVHLPAPGTEPCPAHNTVTNDSSFHRLLLTLLYAERVDDPGACVPARPHDGAAECCVDII